MKEKSLLRRYRWPLFILLWGAGQFSGTMFLYGQTKEAGVGFVIALGIITAHPPIVLYQLIPHPLVHHLVNLAFIWLCLIPAPHTLPFSRPSSHQ